MHLHLINPDVRENIMKAIENLKSKGAEVIDISLPNAKYGSRVYTAVMADRKSVV